MIADRLAAILHDHGRASYDEFDRKAAALLAQGLKDQDPRLLEEVGRSYPAAASLPDALLALGQLQESRQRPIDAAHAYKRLNATVNEPSDRAQALLGLARAYEAQQLGSPARDTYDQARMRCGDQTVQEAGTGMKARADRQRTARARSVRPDGRGPVRAEPADAARPDSGRARSTAECILCSLRALPPRLDSSRVFLVRGTSSVRSTPRTGRPPWSSELDSAPRSGRLSGG